VTERERFSMTPASLEGLDCDRCFRLFHVLDLTQGARGRPFRGYRSMADRTGWDRHTVRTHMRHLQAAGVVTVERDGNRKVWFVVANPARTVGEPQPHRWGSRNPTYNGDSGVAVTPLSRSSRYEEGLVDSEPREVIDAETGELFWVAN
jgi:hypothetical protein